MEYLSLAAKTLISYIGHLLDVILFYRPSSPSIDISLLTTEALDPLLPKGSSGIQLNHKQSSIYLTVIVLSSHHPYHCSLIDTIAQLSKSCPLIKFFYLDERHFFNPGLANVPKAVLSSFNKSQIVVGTLLVYQWTIERPHLRLVQSYPKLPNELTLQNLVTDLEIKRSHDPLSLLAEQDNAYQVSELRDQQKLLSKLKQKKVNSFIHQSFNLANTATNKSIGNVVLGFKMPDGQKIRKNFNDIDSLQLLYGSLYSDNDLKSEKIPIYRITVPKGPSFSFNEIVNRKDETLFSLGLAIDSLLLFIELDFDNSS